MAGSNMSGGVRVMVEGVVPGGSALCLIVLLAPGHKLWLGHKYWRESSPSTPKCEVC